MTGISVGRRNLLVLLAVTWGTTLAFVIAILADFGPGILLHEIAGIVLLVLVLACLDAAYRLRRADLRPLIRVAVAVLLLIWAGSTGAGLALGAIGPALTGLPLLPIFLLLVVLADAARVTRELGRAGAIGAVPMR
ncbi:MAG: hypothetical protein L3K08_00615 [Thermoplasmata archaeon]|nr:hypothetical protein [Thermoplasmata archaeon]